MLSSDNIFASELATVKSVKDGHNDVSGAKKRMGSYFDSMGKHLVGMEKELWRGKAIDV